MIIKINVSDNIDPIEATLITGMVMEFCHEIKQHEYRKVEKFGLSARLSVSKPGNYFIDVERIK
jgi:hypothetical protein